MAASALGSPFSATYGEARDQFLDAAKAAGASLSAYEHPEPGPNGETLTTDVAWIGPADAEAVFVGSAPRWRPAWCTRSTPMASPGAGG
jgi:hypothetical protein